MRYIGLAEAIGIHAWIMERTGYSPVPLRDEHRLEAALMRPRQAAFYEGVDLIRQCVLLAVGISQAQAFLDGNKRTAFATADVFLRLNGYVYEGNPIALAQQLEAVAERDDDLESATDRFEQWLREQVSGPYTS